MLLFWIINASTVQFGGSEIEKLHVIKKYLFMNIIKDEFTGYLKNSLNNTVHLNNLPLYCVLSVAVLRALSLLLSCRILPTPSKACVLVPYKKYTTFQPNVSAPRQTRTNGLIRLKENNIRRVVRDCVCRARVHWMWRNRTHQRLFCVRNCRDDRVLSVLKYLINFK